METYRRKRAVCKMPLEVIERALGLQASQVMVSISQTHEDMKQGVVEIVVEGSSLDPHFATSGPCVEGVAKFVEKPNCQIELVVIPPDVEPESQKNFSDPAP